MKTVSRIFFANQTTTWTAKTRFTFGRNNKRWNSFRSTAFIVQSVDESRFVWRQAAEQVLPSHEIFIQNCTWHAEVWQGVRLSNPHGDRQDSCQSWRVDPMSHYRLCRSALSRRLVRLPATTCRHRRTATNKWNEWSTVEMADNEYASLANLRDGWQF